ncbi:conserved protein of unknown function [Magnetospirillum sp. XM-1]|nr:hypothetical protein [Magnetospirillum sp. XM-1]CUW37280.1 conserved protein of unknown function [Magnetospirillum sp. XM-1]
MPFNLDTFRAGFGATMAQIRDNLRELSRAQEEMHRRIEAFGVR